MPQREFTEQMKVYLTEEEKREHAQEMARAVQGLEELRSQLKEASTDYKSRITAKEAAMTREATLVNNGYEYRFVKCKAEMNTPTEGEKTIIRLDTGAVVRVVGMSDEDHQLVLELAEEEAEGETPEAEPVIEADPGDEDQ